MSQPQTDERTRLLREALTAIELVVDSTDLGKREALVAVKLLAAGARSDTPSIEGISNADLARAARLERAESVIPTIKSLERRGIVAVGRKPGRLNTFTVLPARVIDAVTKSFEEHRRAKAKKQEPAVKRQKPEPVPCVGRALGHGVIVGADAIRGPGFAISLAAVDMACGVTGVEPALGRMIAECVALDWAVNKFVPGAPMAVVRKALATQQWQEQAQKVRLERERKGRGNTGTLGGPALGRNGRYVPDADEVDRVFREGIEAERARKAAKSAEWR